MAANTPLEQIGVETVVASLDKFVKDMQTYIKQIKGATDETKKYQDQSKKTQTTAKKNNAAFSSMGKGLKDIKQSIKGFATSAANSIPILGAFGGAITVALGPIGIAIGLVAALGAGIVALGKRGGEIQAVRTAFGNLVAPILESGESLEGFVDNLKQSAGGTIAELDLLKQTNLALAGTSGALKETFARALPDLLQTAQVQAAATGQSVDFLFESLVVGIKRGSPLLIDNTGLVLNMSDAYQTMADELGVSVTQLTDQQKQIAIINATVAAGNEAVAAAGGIQITANTEIARSQAILRDTVDSLALSLEPLAAVILRVINIGLQWVGSIVQDLAPKIRWFGEFIRDGFAQIQSIMNAFSKGTTQGIIFFGDTFLGQVIQKILPAINFLKNGFLELGQFLKNAITAYLQFSVNVAAAIGNGLMAGANTFIFPAVIQIATFIADFLAGFSPPKKGPLSTIDKGAANVMSAWTEGFVGAFQPQAIEDVAGQVNTIMGDISELGIKQVGERLKQLDQQIQPFVEQVKIVKDQFQAMQSATEAGMRAIDRQLNSAMEALMRGDEGAAELVQSLNIQREALQNNLDLEQQRMDAAEIQLAFAKSQQQQERTLLELQKARLGEQKKITKESIKQVEETKEAIPKAPKKLTGKATPIEAAAVGGGGAALSPALEKEMETFGQGGPTENPFEGLLEFGAELSTDFMSGLSAGGELDQFQSNISELGSQVDRIAESDPVKGIVGAFEGLGTDLGDAAKEAVSSFIGFFTDPQMEGSLAQFIARINSEGFAAVFGDISEGITSWFTSDLVPTFKEGINSVVLSFTDPSNPDSLYSKFQLFSSDFGASFGDISEGVKSWFSDLEPTFKAGINSIVLSFTDPSNPDSLYSNFQLFATDFGGNFGDMTEGITSWFTNDIVPIFREGVALILSVFKDPSDPDSLYSRFQEFSTDFGAIVGDIGETLKATVGTWITDNLIIPIQEKVNEFFDIANEEGFFGAFLTMSDDIIFAVGDMLGIFNSLFDPVRAFAAGETEGGGLPALVDSIVDILGQMPQKIFDALSNMGLIFYAVFIEPFAKIIDQFIILVNELLANITDSDVFDFLKSNPVTAGLFQAVPDQLVIPTVSATLNPAGLTPVFPTATKQARGGILQGPAMVNTGERGMESHFLAPQQAMMTFSNQFVRAMETISNALMSDGGGGMNIAQPINNNSSTATDNRSYTVNAKTQNGLSGADLMNQMAINRIFD